METPAVKEDLAAESEAKIKQSSVLLRSEIKSWWVLKVMSPLERFCVRRGILPNAITLFGLGIFFFCSVLYATGHFLSAGWVVFLGGSLDVLDGRVARATDQVSESGAFLDSVIDRYQDCLLFAGLGIFYRHSWILYVVLLALTGALVISYTRAKAETLGVDLSKVGVMQRPERLFLLGFGSIVSSVLQISLMPFYGKGNFPPQHLLIITLIVLAVSTNLTAIRRIRYTMKALKEKSS